MDLQSISFNHSDTYPLTTHPRAGYLPRYSLFWSGFGATHRNRTDNLPITNRVLYQLS